MAKTNLSLGKLRRATDPGNVSSDSTANSKLRADSAGVSSGNNFKISEPKEDIYNDEYHLFNDEIDEEVFI